MEKYLDNYQIIVRPWKEQYRAAAWRNKFPTLEPEMLPSPLKAEGASEDEALREILAAVDHVEREARGLLLATLNERHDAYLVDQKVRFVGRAMRTKFGQRRAHCIGRHHQVDSRETPECKGCDAVICLYCAGCGCGSGAWTHPYQYSEEKLAMFAAFISVLDKTK